jgi:hypothetical protein
MNARLTLSKFGFHFRPANNGGGGTQASLEEQGRGAPTDESCLRGHFNQRGHIKVSNHCRRFFDPALVYNPFIDCSSTLNLRRINLLLIKL